VHCGSHCSAVHETINLCLVSLFWKLFRLRFVCNWVGRTCLLGHSSTTNNCTTTANNRHHLWWIQGEDEKVFLVISGVPTPNHQTYQKVGDKVQRVRNQPWRVEARRQVRLKREASWARLTDPHAIRKELNRLYGVEIDSSKPVSSKSATVLLQDRNIHDVSTARKACCWSLLGHPQQAHKIILTMPYRPDNAVFFALICSRVGDFERMLSLLLPSFHIDDETGVWQIPTACDNENCEKYLVHDIDVKQLLDPECRWCGNYTPKCKNGKSAGVPSYERAGMGDLHNVSGCTMSNYVMILTVLLGLTRILQTIVRTFFHQYGGSVDDIRRCIVYYNQRTQI
jgi:hypothetical protein